MKKPFTIEIPSIAELERIPPAITLTVKLTRDEHLQFLHVLRRYGGNKGELLREFVLAGIAQKSQRNGADSAT